MTDDFDTFDTWAMYLGAFFVLLGICLGIASLVLLVTG